MIHHGGSIDRSDPEKLHPFEYVDVNGDRACCFQIFCNCGALDSTCDKAFSCDCASIDLEPGLFRLSDSFLHYIARL